MQATELHGLSARYVSSMYTIRLKYAAVSCSISSGPLLTGYFRERRDWCACYRPNFQSMSGINILAGAVDNLSLT